MLENVGDYLSLITLVVITILAVYNFIVIFNSHHMDHVRKREERYYAFYENADDEYDENNDEPYYE